MWTEYLISFKSYKVNCTYRYIELRNGCSKLHSYCNARRHCTFQLNEDVEAFDFSTLPKTIQIIMSWTWVVQTNGFTLFMSVYLKSS